MIKQWPLGERPREKLKAKGAANLSDAELLAILLRSGRPGEDVVALSRRLIQTYGGLKQLMALNCEAYCKNAGVGEASWVQLQVVMELSCRVHESNVAQLRSFTSVAEVFDYLRSMLARSEREQFFALWLDSQHRLTCSEVLSQGTLDSAAVYPREVVKRALAVNAGAVIFAHNHPSGLAEPSQADVHITAELKKALALIGVRMLDHVIVTGNHCVSMAQRGLIA